MTAEILDDRVEPSVPPDGLAMLAFLLRWRGVLVTLVLVGGLAGGAVGILRARVYKSKATFLPQSSDAGISSAGLALAASQLDIQLPGLGRGQWGTAVYANLLTSDGLLSRIALDSFQVSTPEPERVPLEDLLRVPKGRPEVRRELTVRRLRALIAVREIKPVGGVEVVVVSRWPTVSLAITQRLVHEVQQFVQTSRQSQASAERAFAERRASEERASLDASEARLRAFLESNRSIGGAPELVFERDRLQRDVALRQQIYASMVQAREEARLREVRDTPVITLIEQPSMPAIPESRRSVLRGAIGAMMGATLALGLGLLAELLRMARRSDNPDAKQIVRFVDRFTPKSRGSRVT